MDVSSGAFMYESQCSSDSMRITKSQKVYGLSVCPISELKAAVITSEGKVLIWQLQATQVCTCLLKCLLHVNMWGLEVCSYCFEISCMQRQYSQNSFKKFYIDR